MKTTSKKNEKKNEDDLKKNIKKMKTTSTKNQKWRRPQKMKTTSKKNEDDLKNFLKKNWLLHNSKLTLFYYKTLQMISKYLKIWSIYYEFNVERFTLRYIVYL